MLGFLVQAGAHKGSTAKERWGVLFKWKLARGQQGFESVLHQAGLEMRNWKSLRYLEKLHFNLSQKIAFQSVPKSYISICPKKPHFNRSQVQGAEFRFENNSIFSPPAPTFLSSPNWKITTDQRQCCCFSSVFIYLLLYLWGQRLRDGNF